MNKRGFTLMELIVTISILAILSSISIPVFATWLPNYRLKASVRRIFDDMNTAKVNSIKNRDVTVVIFSPANDTYTVFVDSNGSWSLDSTETVLSSGTLDEDIDLYDSTFVSHTYGFSFRGMPQTPLTGPYSVYLKNSKGRYLGVRVNVAGNLSIIESTDNGATWN